MALQILVQFTVSSPAFCSVMTHAHIQSFTSQRHGSGSELVKLAVENGFVMWAWAEPNLFHPRINVWRDGGAKKPEEVWWHTGMA